MFYSSFPSGPSVVLYYYLHLPQCLVYSPAFSLALAFLNDYLVFSDEC